MNTVPSEFFAAAQRVFVEGTEIAVDGDYTGERPGRVLRSGTDTETATLKV